MSTLCAEMWILICLFIVSQLSGVRSQFCPTGWELHLQSVSCMKLIQGRYTYVQVREYCQKNTRSSNTNKQGHLVFIFDKATDDFVKGLLAKLNVDKAFIGLHHRGTFGVYYWGDSGDRGDSKLIPVTYTGWSDNPHTPDFNKRDVVITKDGWEDYDADSKAYFVCQVDADFPTPRVTCPVAEEGQESPAISCSIDSPQSLRVTDLRFENAAGQLAICDVNGGNCSPGQRQPKYINGDITRNTSSALSWNLKLKRVIRSDETDWTCSVVFTGAGSWITSKSCSLKVYTKPTGLTCTHTLLEYRVNATCTGSRVYPQAACSWKARSGSRYVKVFDPRESNVWQSSGEQYYTTSCSAALDITDGGRYDITVSMFPAAPAFVSLQNQLAVTGSTSLDVDPPSGPPSLYIGIQPLLTPWWDVVENETLIIACQVLGGNPPVFSTIINCDKIPPESMVDGLAVKITIAITRVWHGRKCECSALHAARYSQTSSVEIRVKFPATVTDFSITGPHGITASGDDVTFTCTASGNPAPQLFLHLRNGAILASNQPLLPVIGTDLAESNLQPSTSNLTHTKTAACSDSGWYQCLASNTINGQLYRYYKYAHLQVRCAPEHCHKMSSHRFPADVTAGTASIQICVRAHPGPTKMILYKVLGSTTKYPLLNAPRFQTSFQFTSEDDGQGEITVMISPFTQEDIGEYLIYSEYRPYDTVHRSSNLSFELVAQESPSCPTNLTVVKVGSDSVTLSWTPGFNGGLNQNFTVLRVDVTETSAPGHTVLGTVADQGGHHVYDVTGLSESTVYTFGIEARNKEGSGNCSHLLVRVSTSASPAEYSGGYLVSIIIGAVVALVLVVILVLVVVVVRRRRGYGPKKTGAAVTLQTGSADRKMGTSDEANPYLNVCDCPSETPAAALVTRVILQTASTNIESDTSDVTNSYQSLCDCPPEGLPATLTTTAAFQAGSIYNNMATSNETNIYEMAETDGYLVPDTVYAVSEDATRPTLMETHTYDRPFADTLYETVITASDSVHAVSEDTRSTLMETHTYDRLFADTLYEIPIAAPRNLTQ